MTPLHLAALLLTLAHPAMAQPSARTPATFNCVGAEELEDDVFEIPFAPGRDRVTDAARASLAAATERLKAEPARNACILGHARREGGQATSVQLASRRARAVNEALRAAGLPASRLRSEARVAGFSRTTGNTIARSVSIVVMPGVVMPGVAMPGVGTPGAARAPAAAPE